MEGLYETEGALCMRKRDLRIERGWGRTEKTRVNSTELEALAPGNRQFLITGRPAEGVIEPVLTQE